MNVKKYFAVMCAAMMMASSFAGCGASGSAEAEGSTSEGGETTTTESTESTETTGGSVEELTFGVLAPLTGNASVYGNSTKNGIELGMEDINANGGKLSIEVLDEKGEEAEAVNAYNMLMQKGVDAIVGDVTSKPSIAVADYAATDYEDGIGVPVITPTGTAADITLKGDNIFRACFLDPFQGEVMATFAAENLQAQNVALLYNTSDDYSNGIAEAFEAAAAEKGMTVVAKEGYGASDKDFKTQLTKIQAANPDVIMVPDYYNNVALIVKQAREVGYDGPMIGGDGWDGVLAVLDEGSQDLVNNCYFPNHYFVDDTDEKVATFVASYREKYGEDPTAFSALGYDAINIMYQAFQKAGSTDPEAVVEALKGMEYDGVTGHITFDENGDPIKTVSILEYKDGKIVLNTKIG